MNGKGTSAKVPWWVALPNSGGQVTQEEILTGLRGSQTIDAALRQAYEIGRDGALGIDAVAVTLRRIADEVGPPSLKGVMGVVRVDSRSEGWTKIGQTGLEIRDWGSDAQTYQLEYRAVPPEIGSAGD
jgi:hypothetical protein